MQHCQAFSAVRYNLVMAEPRTVDEYIASAPDEMRQKLRQIRQVTRELAPDAQEKLSYGMPYYSLNGRLLYFAYFKDHVSLFAMPSAITEFEKDLTGYKTSKGTIQFPLGKPLPLSLIRRIIEFRADEQRAKSK